MNRIDKSLSDKDKEKVVKYIGDIYRKSKKRIDVFEFQNAVNENRAIYESDRSLVQLVDRTLEDCSKDTRIIIRYSYLENTDPHWYLNYYARTTYYRYRKEAINEFINCLNI